MDPSKWQRVKELFHRAVEVEPDERLAYIEQACGGDHELRDEVWSLLRADQSSHSPLEAAVVDALDVLPIPGLPGTRVKQYEIVKHIASGGMGDVFLARDTLLHRKVALKFLSGHLVSSAPIRSRFLHEVKAAARLHHNNIITIYEVSEFEGLPFFAMEYLQGSSLRELMIRHTIDLEQFVAIILAICSGLSAAHAGGVIHRDIKPENIVVCDDGAIKLLDFGIAKTTEETRLTSPGSPLGTANYMSPEQARGEEVDHRTDIFSVGVVMYEMLARYPPFRQDNIPATINSIINDEPCSLLEIKPDIPDYLWDIVRRALQKRALDRYEEMSELSADLVRRSTSKRVPPRTSPVLGSLVVFPFRSLPGAEELEYVADGICEDVISLLSKLEQLRVAGKTVSFKFKGKEYDPLEITRQLGMHYALEGSIRKYGDKIRIGVQLVAVDGSVVVWSDCYNRRLTDILGLQTEVAGQIAGALNLTLGGREMSTFRRTPTQDAEAYDLYLRGRHYLKKRDQVSLEKAIELFGRAVSRDPDFAEAGAQLVVAHCLHENYGYGLLKDSQITVLELASRAVELQPESAEAHLAVFLAVRRENLRRGIAELRMAVALDPSNNEAHHYLAHAYAMSGRYFRAARHERIALQHDPFQDASRAHICRLCHFLDQPDRANRELELLFAGGRSESLAWLTKGSLEWYRHNWEEAHQALESAVRLDPNNVYAHYYLADCYLRAARPTEALSLLEHGIGRLANRYPLHQRMGHVCRASGRTDLAAAHFATAHKLLDSSCLRSTRQSSAVYIYDKAMLLTLEGRSHEAIKQLADGMKCGLGHYADLESRPDWDELQGEPEFKALLATMKEALADDLSP